GHPSGALAMAHRKESGLFPSFLGRLANQFFLDARGFTRTAAQIIKFSTAYIAATLHFYAGDLRGIQLESTLDRFTRGNLADDERGIEAAVAPADDHAFVGLHTLAVAFDDIDVDDDGIAGAEIGLGFAAGKAGDFFLFKKFDKVHGEHSS